MTAIPDEHGEALQRIAFGRTAVARSPVTGELLSRTPGHGEDEAPDHAVLWELDARGWIDEHGPSERLVLTEAGHAALRRWKAGAAARGSG